MKSIVLRFLVVCSFVLSMFKCNAAFSNSTDIQNTETMEKSSESVNHLELRNLVFEKLTEEEKLFLSKAGIELKPWNENEKTLLKNQLKFILNKIPALLRTVCLQGKLILVRSSSYHHKREDLLKNSPVEAYTIPGVIVFTDQYFSISDPLRSLIHELIHIVDTGFIYSYSQEWAKLAEKKIAKIRIRIKSLRPDQRKKYFQYLKEQKVCPSVLGSIDLKEALAVYVTANLIEKSKTGLSQFNLTKGIESRMWKPSSSIVQFQKFYKLGIKSYILGHYKQSKSFFENAIAYYPGSPMPDYYISGIYMDSKNDLKTIESSLAVLKKFDNNSIYSVNTEKEEVLLNCATAYNNVGRFKKSEELANKLIKIGGKSSEVYDIRAYSRLMQKKIFSGTLDLLNGQRPCGFFNNGNWPAHIDKSFSESFAETIIQRYKSKAYLAASIYEQLGDSSTNRDKILYLEKALIINENLLKVGFTNKVSILISCARIQFKLGKLEQTKFYCNKILQIEKSNVFARLLLLQVNDNNSTSSEVLNKFKVLQRDIEQNRNKPRVTTDYAVLSMFELINIDSPLDLKRQNANR